MLTLILMRHPPIAAAPGLCYGRFEPGLAAGWENLVDAALTKLDVEPQLIISSPARRCSLAAVRIAARLGLPEPECDDRLQELDFGAWEGRLWQDIPRHESDPWSEDYLNLSPPGGETMLAMQHRLLDWLAVARRHASAGQSNIMAITHCGAIRILVAECLSLALPNAFRLHVDYAGLTMLRFSDSGCKLLALNR